MLSSPKFVSLCIAFGLLLRVGWLLLWSPAPISDFADYMELAEALVNGEGYSVNGVATGFRAPGYPVFLAGLFAVFGVKVWVGQLANLLLAGIAMWLVYDVSKMLFADEGTGRIALLLMALHPNGIAYTSLLSTELLFVVLLLAGVACGMRMKGHWGWVVATGLVFGLAAYVKPQAVLVPLVLLLGGWITHRAAPSTSSGASGDPAQRINMRPTKASSWKLAWISAVWGWFVGNPRLEGGVLQATFRAMRHRREPQLLLAFIFTVLVISPWALRNASYFGTHPQLTTNGGSNLLVGNNPYSNGKYKWGAAEEAFLAPFVSESLNEAERDQVAGKVAWQYIKNHPGQFLARVPLKLWRCYAWDMEGLDWVREGCGGFTGWRHQVMRIWKAWAQVFYVGLLVLFGLSFFAKSSLKTPYFYWGIALILYFSVVVMVFFGDGRFHFPVLPWVMMYAAERIKIEMKIKIKV